MENTDRNKKGQFTKGYKNPIAYKPIIGKKYNLFTIISEIMTLSKDKKNMFHVKCECGKEQYVRAYFLESGRQKGCKSCSSKNNYYKAIKEGKKVGFVKLTHEGVGDITKTFYGHIKRGAKKRNKSWNKDITIKFLWELYLKQNKKCALSNLDIFISDTRKDGNVNWDDMTASLDRIDNNKDYTIDNVQWVHKDVNRLKWNFSQERLFELCELINIKNKSTLSQVS